MIAVKEEDPNEPFTQALRRALEPVVGAPDVDEAFWGAEVDTWGSAWWLRLGDGRADRMPVWTDPHLSVREMRLFLGDQPERLTLAAGIGAGPEPFPILESIWQLVNVGLTLEGLRSLIVHAGYPAIYQRLYAADWKALADWKHTGAMTRALEQAGRSERNWNEKMLARRFGADANDARLFMSALGYQPVIQYDGTRIWRDPSD